MRKNGKASSTNRVQKKPQASRQRKQAKQRGRAGTIRAILDEEADDDSDGEVDEEHEGLEEESTGTADESEEDGPDDKAGEEEGEEEASDPRSSPEPDFILAEVTNSSRNARATTSSSSSEFAISLPLIHRIMQSHFNAPEKTVISSDARALVGRYVEIFVKEGITRCVNEKKEREASGGGGTAFDSGWLEVEDLERVATQLCMDF